MTERNSNGKNGRRQVVISVDYEIFGNGTGDVRRHIIDPTERMAKTCEAHQVPLTVFFEVEEYLAYVQYAKNLKSDLGYDPAALIHDQIVGLIRRGHDVQLHLHPEWFGARYENKTWQLHLDKPTVDSLFQTQPEVNAYIAERKGVIDKMAAEAGSASKVRAYRAGAFSAQPGQRLLAALAANDIKIDSSVVKGLFHHRNGETALDYRSAPCAKGPWPISNDVIRPDPAGKLWEFPTYAVMGRRLQQATLGRLRAKFSKNVPKNRQKEMVKQLRIGRSPAAWLKFLWQPVPIKLDYHNVSAPRLLRWIKEAPKAKDSLPDAVVLIGHTKEHIEDRTLDALLAGARAAGDLEIVGFDTLAAKL